MNALTLELRTDAVHDERRVLDDLRRAGAFATDADVVKVALWKLGRHLDVAMPAEAWALPYTPPVVAEELALEQEQLSLLEREGL